MNQKMSLCDALIHRSIDNQLITYRHNKKEDEKLEKRFSLYYRQMSLIDRHIHMAQRRCEQYARNDLGLLITSKRKPLESSIDRPFYYSSTNKNRITKEYSVEPLHKAINHKNMYEFVFERRSREYMEEMKQKQRIQTIKKRQFLENMEEIMDNWNGNWPLSDNARVKLPSIIQTKNLPEIKISFRI